MINKTLQLIKKQTGLELELCDCFTGIYKIGELKYFNVVLKERVSESSEYKKLENFANKYKLIKIESNGVNRVAVFF